ncbi:MAG: amidase family protein [Paraglaciecola sp.]|uniref:amidase family protein n=1 Tax=Paraglaciecola sp. TaxID=1920173 RepID=UPI00329A6B75
MSEIVESISINDAIEIGKLDAHAQANLLIQKELSKSTLCQAAIVRIEHINPRLNAVVYNAFDYAMEKSLQPSSSAMAGVPYLLKASAAYPGFPMHCGSRSMLGKVAKFAYPFATKLDNAGLIPVGMSSMPEFGLLASGEPVLYGATHNPWALDRSTAGSSSGAAAAVAAGLVPLAHASDAAGSIRMPASACGVIGYKPSRGYNLRARVHHLIDDLLCSDSLLARSMRDTIWAANVVRPPTIPIYQSTSNTIHRPLKIAGVLRGIDGTKPDYQVERVFHQTARLLQDSLGHELKYISLPIDEEAVSQALKVLWSYLGGELRDQCIALNPFHPIDDLLEPWTIGLALQRDTYSTNDLANAFSEITKATLALEQFHQKFDVILSPVNSTAPPQIGHLAPTQPFENLWEALFKYMNYTPLHNITGTPSISLPLFMSNDNMPIGSLFSAAFGKDDILLNLAEELEQTLPWAARWPSIF